MNFKTSIKNILAISVLFGLSHSVLANDQANNDQVMFPIFSQPGWNTFASEDGLSESLGGQRYDTEYLFYKYTSDTGMDNKGQLSIGLQTGFDLWDGEYNGIYTGDIALSFTNQGDVDNNIYEYALDFGLTSRDKNNHAVEDNNFDGVSYDNDNDGIDTAGLYSVTTWNNSITHPDSNPFAMDEGTLIEAFAPAVEYDGFNPWPSPSNVPGENPSDGISDISVARGWSDYTNDGGIDSSYFRVVTFDLANIANLSSNFTVDSHWTMSCGNDHINGSFDIAGNTTNPVPEPSILALFSIGSLSIGFMGYRRKKMIGNMIA